MSINHLIQAFMQGILVLLVSSDKISLTLCGIFKYHYHEAYKESFLTIIW